jgi:hypothetical protein
MDEYKTTINIYLNGAGVVYHVKQDVETVKYAFLQCSDLVSSGGFYIPAIFTDVKHRDEIIPMVIINPANCASIEIYESYSVRKGK